jgi:hypothetical protein
MTRFEGHGSQVQPTLLNTKRAGYHSPLKLFIGCMMPLFGWITLAHIVAHHIRTLRQLIGFLLQCGY